MTPPSQQGTQGLLEIEAIKLVKHRYMRFTMTGEIEAMRDLLTPDVKAEYAPIGE